MAVEDAFEVVPPGQLYTMLSALTAIFLPTVLIYYGWFKWFDLAYRMSLAELNRRWNRHRYTEQAILAAPSTMACIVGYREDPTVYEKSLISLKKGGTGCVVVAIDGNEAEDMRMVGTFEKVFQDSAKNVLDFPHSPGTRFARQLGITKSTRKPVNGHENGHTNGHTNGCVKRPHSTAAEFDDLPANEAFQSSYDFVKDQLSAAGLLRGAKPPKALCFTQPHGDLKEIRYSAWMVSFVLADVYGFEYIWSSDSDTRVMPDTIDTLARVIRADKKAAGGGVYVKLHNASASTFSRMASLAWALDTYMNRAALGAFGTSECLNGPSSMFRISALRDVAVPQYRFHYFQQKQGSYQNTVINEDIQTTMLLAKRGWRRLYIENAYILTGGPETLRQWLGQRLRWSRGINLHRLFDAWYISSQGPLTAWYWLRSGFYDVFVFLWVSWYTFTGKRLFPVSASDIIVVEILPPLYNFTRCSASLPNLLIVIPLYAFYRLVCPSYRMYTFLTPFGIGWTLPKRQPGERFNLIKFTRREHETLFFVLWMSIVAGAVGRWLSGYDFVPYTAEVMVASFMTVTWTTTSLAMFAA